MAETIALVGGETLLGREVRDVLGETALGRHLRLVAGAEEDTGTLTEVGGEAAVLSRLNPEELEAAEVVILAGSVESSQAVLEAHPEGVVIDLTPATEDDPAARVRAPQFEGADFHEDGAGPWIVAHPAALAIALILRRLHKDWPIARCVVQVFEPASERGKAGIEELQQQTVNLLSFQQLPKKVFDTQASFAMLAELGPEAPVHLHDVEERIERHLASLLERSEGVPMPSLRVIQAPVFHGYSFSFWIEFEDAPAASDVEESFSRDPFDLRGGDLEPPNNVGMAGQSGIAVGNIASDRNSGNAVWLWAAVDNLRLAAESAALLAGEIL